MLYRPVSQLINDSVLQLPYPLSMSSRCSPFAVAEHHGKHCNFKLVILEKTEPDYALADLYILKKSSKLLISDFHRSLSTLYNV